MMETAFALVFAAISAMAFLAALGYVARAVGYRTGYRDGWNDRAKKERGK